MTFKRHSNYLVYLMVCMTVLVFIIERALFYTAWLARPLQTTVLCKRKSINNIGYQSNFSHFFHEKNIYTNSTVNAFHYCSKTS